MAATIAEALHYAHKQGFVHRHIKPGNIMIAKSGQPFLVDFGLALKEENVGHGPTHAETPAYMSPENSQDKTRPVGSLKPNDLGFFDVQGNVWEWCLESYKAYPVGKGDEAAEDQEGGLVVNSTDS